MYRSYMICDNKKITEICSHSQVLLHLHLDSMFFVSEYLFYRCMTNYQLLFSMNIFGIQVSFFCATYCIHIHAMLPSSSYFFLLSNVQIRGFFLALTFKVFQMLIFTSCICFTIFSLCFRVLSLQLKFSLVLILILVWLNNPNILTFFVTPYLLFSCLCNYYVLLSFAETNNYIYSNIGWLLCQTLTAEFLKIP